MGQVHQLILSKGIDEAKAQTADKLERQCVETAFAVMSDEQQRIGIMHAGFAMTALPHKAIDETIWVRQGNNIKLRLESGVDADDKVVGLRIASPEMLPRPHPLPHLTCSRPGFSGDGHETDQHGNA
jgi:hypothetical protein